MHKIMVTGGAGFIGSSFIRLALQNTDNNLINLDDLTYGGNLDSLKDIENNLRYKFAQGDICDQELVKRLLSEYYPEFIVHFAASRNYLFSTTFAYNGCINVKKVLN